MADLVETVAQCDRDAAEELGKDEMIEHLRSSCTAFKSQKDAAKALGISAQYLSDMLQGYRNIGPTTARKLGYEMRIVYRPLAKAKEEMLG